MIGRYHDHGTWIPKAETIFDVFCDFGVCEVTGLTVFFMEVVFTAGVGIQCNKHAFVVFIIADGSFVVNRVVEADDLVAELASFSFVELAEQLHEERLVNRKINKIL